MPNRMIVVDEGVLEELFKRWMDAEDALNEETSWEMVEARGQTSKDELDMRSRLFKGVINAGSVMGEVLLMEYTPPTK